MPPLFGLASWAAAAVIAVLAAPTAHAQMVLSSSTFKICSAVTADFINFECSQTDTVSSLIISTPLNVGPANSAFQFDMTSGDNALPVEPTTIQVQIVTDLVWDYEIDQIDANKVPYDYVAKERVAGLNPPNSCPFGSMIANVISECGQPNYCAATQSEVDAAMSTAENKPRRARDAWSAARDLDAGGPRLSYWCGSDPLLCEAGAHIDQNWWITPTYYKRIATADAKAFYRLQAIVTKNSDPGNPEFVEASSYEPIGYSATSRVAINIITILTPTSQGAPTFPGVFIVPVDAPYKNEGLATVVDPFINPRAGAVWPFYDLPKWAYDPVVSDYGNGCCKNGLPQSYNYIGPALGTGASAPGTMSAVCRGQGASKCVPGTVECNADLVFGTVADRLESRYINWQLDPIPNPGYLPNKWNGQRPNMWLFDTHFYYTQSDPTVSNVEVQIVVSGDFVQVVTSISTGEFEPFGQDACATVEGATTGEIEFSVTNTGAGNGQFSVEMTCSGGANAVEPAVSNFNLGPGQTATQQLAVGADSSTGGTSGTCTLTLYAVAAPFTKELQDTATTDCRIANQFTLAPPPTGTNAPGTGDTPCDAFDILCKLGITNPFSKLVRYLVYALILCCCCCCCVICVFLCIAVLPGLLGGATAASAGGGGGGGGGGTPIRAELGEGTPGANARRPLLGRPRAAAPVIAVPPGASTQRSTRTVVR